MLKFNDSAQQPFYLRQKGGKLCASTAKLLVVLVVTCVVHAGEKCTATRSRVSKVYLRVRPPHYSSIVQWQDAWLLTKLSRFESLCQSHCIMQNYITIQVQSNWLNNELLTRHLQVRILPLEPSSECRKDYILTNGLMVWVSNPTEPKINPQ